jgi:hypothetical protein
VPHEDCPACRGDTDPLAVLRSLCPKHLAEVLLPSEERVLAVLQEGLRARAAALSARPSPRIPRGFFR